MAKAPSGGDVKLNTIHALNDKQILVRNIEQNKDDLYDLGYIDDDQIFSSTSVKVNGVEFRSGLFVCIKVAHVRDDNLPLFGRIEKIFILRDHEVYLQTSVCTSILFDPDLNAYQIEVARPDDLYRSLFIPTSTLACYTPFCSWTRSNSNNNLYISLRYVLL